MLLSVSRPSQIYVTAFKDYRTLSVANMFCSITIPDQNLCPVMKIRVFTLNG